MKAGSLKHMMRYISIFSLAVCIGVFLWGFQSGVFTSQEKMEETISRCGIWGPALFILFQAVQVVFPVLPGGIGCLAGIILFGTIQGFFVQLYRHMCWFSHRFCNREKLGTSFFVSPVWRESSE